MASRKAIGCLAVASCLSIASLVAISISAQSENAFPLLRLIAAPVELTSPFVPPLLLMALFAHLRPGRPYWKLAARLGAALLLSAALLWVMMGYAFAGTFSAGYEDAQITGGLLLGGVLLAAAGFWPATDWNAAE